MVKKEYEVVLTVTIPVFADNAEDAESIGLHVGDLFMDNGLKHAVVTAVKVSHSKGYDSAREALRGGDIHTVAYLLDEDPEDVRRVSGKEG